jgi:hypothetical protein
MHSEFRAGALGCTAAIIAGLAETAGLGENVGLAESDERTFTDVPAGDTRAGFNISSATG